MRVTILPNTKRGILSLHQHNKRLLRIITCRLLRKFLSEFTRIGVEIVGMGEGGPGRLTVVKSREKAVYGLGRGNAASSPEMILISGQTTIFKLKYRAKSFACHTNLNLTYLSKSSNL